MNEYFKLGYPLIFGLWLVVGVNWIKAGRPLIKRQKQYQPWLEPNSYLNKYIGYHFFIGGIFFSFGCALGILGILIELVLHHQLQVKLFCELSSQKLATIHV
ncbi:MAG: hypothetical protein CL608_32005 [Anaerolineaceae bacterium]|nr:hypothetical protein [Anaerolineaceae bacterium]